MHAQKINNRQAFYADVAPVNKPDWPWPSFMQVLLFCRKKIISAIKEYKITMKFHIKLENIVNETYLFY